VCVCGVCVCVKDECSDCENGDSNTDWKR